MECGKLTVRPTESSSTSRPNSRSTDKETDAATQESLTLVQFTLYRFQLFTQAHMFSTNNALEFVEGARVSRSIVDLSILSFIQKRVQSRAHPIPQRRLPSHRTPQMVPRLACLDIMPRPVFARAVFP